MLRLASGQATEADGAAFRQWCGQSVEHARAFKETRAAWQALQPPPGARAQMARAQPGRRGGALPGGALAACAPIWRSGRLDLWPAVSELAADYRSGAGEQREVALGEDATVQMNTRTRINVSAQARANRWTCWLARSSCARGAAGQPVGGRRQRDATPASTCATRTPRCA